MHSVIIHLSYILLACDEEITLAVVQRGRAKILPLLTAVNPTGNPEAPIVGNYHSRFQHHHQQWGIAELRMLRSTNRKTPLQLCNPPLLVVPKD